MDRYHEKYFDDKAVGTTRTFAAHAAGGEDKLEKALETGEVIKTVDANGMDFFSRRQFHFGNRGGNKHAFASSD